MGRNSYMISGMDSVTTTFCYPKYPESFFPPPLNTSVVTVPFLLVPAPGGFLRIWHEVLRILHIIRFSVVVVGIFFRERHEIIHVHSPMFFLIALVARLLGRRCYITYHGREHEMVYNKKILGLLFNKVFKKTFCLSDNINTYKEFYSNYSINFVAIDNAVDSSIFNNKGIKREG